MDVLTSILHGLTDLVAERLGSDFYTIYHDREDRQLVLWACDRTPDCSGGMPIAAIDIDLVAGDIGMSLTKLAAEKCKPKKRFDPIWTQFGDELVYPNPVRIDLSDPHCFTKIGDWLDTIKVLRIWD